MIFPSKYPTRIIDQLECLECIKCEKWLPLNHFRNNGKHIRHTCKLCEKAYQEQRIERGIHGSTLVKNVKEIDGKIFKLCLCCNNWLKIENFRKDVSTRLGYSGHACKKCKGLAYKESKKKYDQTHREQTRANRKIYRKNNPEAMRCYARKYRRSDLYKNSNYKIANDIRSRMCCALKQTNNKKCSGTADLLGCSIDDFKRHIESTWSEGMHWGNRGYQTSKSEKKWHIDHIRPCASFDLSDPEQQYQCFHYTNLQALWHEDNMKKSDQYQPLTIHA